MQNNTNIESQNTSTEHMERSSGRRESRRSDRQGHDHRAHRSAGDIMQNLPTGWTASVVEPDSEGTKEQRVRLRVMLFENPDKGYKLLPFMTVRYPRRVETEAGSMEVMDDMDVLPNNVLECALPAIIFNTGHVLEAMLEMFAEYSKKQAALPPPSKRPLTQRPFAESLAKVVRTAQRDSRQREQQAQYQHEQQQAQQAPRTRNRRNRRERLSVLMAPLF